MKKIQPIYAVFITLFLLYAFSSNPPNGRTSAPGEGSCTGCHRGAGGGFEGNVVLEGLPDNIMPSTTYNLTLTTSATNGNPIRAGFQMIILDGGNNNVGTFNNFESGTSPETNNGRTYWEHRSARNFDANGQAVWTTDWTSPVSADNDAINVYINSLIANGSGSSGDLVVSSQPTFSLQGVALPPVTAQITNTTDVDCFGDNTGSATVNGGGGDGIFTYAWSNGQSSATINNLPAGTYTVTVTDGMGTTSTATTTINQPSQLSVNISNSIDIDCNTPNGSATASANGGTDNYTYRWSTNAVGSTVNLPAGTHQVTATDANNCTTTTSVTITQDTQEPTADAGSNITITCADANTSTAQINGTGSSTGTGITYAWQTTNGNIIAGGNTSTPTVNASTVDFDVAMPIANAGSTQQLNCATTSVTLDGSASSQGNEFTYQWSDNGGGTFVSGQNTPTSVVSSAATYVLTVVNTQNSCSATSTVVVTQDAVMPMANAGSALQRDCNNSILTLNGSASAGTSIEWTTADGQIMSGGTTLNPIVASAGTYTLRATNPANNCTAVSSVTVVDNFVAPILATTNADQLNCITSQVTLSGATTTEANVTYQWTTTDGNILSGQNGINPIVDAVGTYNLLATNTTNGCTTSGTVVVTQDIQAPDAQAGADAQLSCTTTSLALNGTGSTGSNITYQWTTNNGNILSDGTTLNPVVNAAGTYTLTATNTTNGCTISDVVVITQDVALPAVDAGSTQIFGCTTTSLILSGNGSIGDDITYEWTTTDGNISQDANTLTPTITSAGTYLLTVNNTTTGCSASASVTITNADTPDADAGTAPTLDCNATDLILNGSGSVGATITYNWTTTDGNISQDANTLTPTITTVGTYTLTVTNNATGCSSNSLITISATASPVANAGTANVINCNNPTVSLNGNASSGENLSYTWTSEDGLLVDGANTATPTVATAGIYTLMVTNEVTGCNSSAIVNVTADLAVPMAEIIGGETQSIACVGDELAIATNASLGNNFTYFWCTEDGNIVSGAEAPNVVINGGGLFEFIVTNTTNGCTNVDTVIVNDAVTLEVGVAEMGEGTITVVVTGGVAPYTYIWDTDNQDTTPSVAGLEAGTYNVTVTDANGCAETLEILLELSTSTSELDEFLANLQVYPNPTSDFVSINVRFTTPKNGQLFVVNPIGQQLWEQAFDGQQLNYLVEVSNWSNGIYRLLIQTADGVKTEEIVVID